MKHLIIPMLLVGGFVALMTTEASAVTTVPPVSTERAASHDLPWVLLLSPRGLLLSPRGLLLSLRARSLSRQFVDGFTDWR